MLFTQCKKNEVVTPTGGNKVKITLTLDNNSKVDVNTESGAVTFEEGDEIHVAYRHKHVGSLSCDNSGVFVGELEIGGAYGDFLYFYFLGNKFPEELASEGDETLTVNIMDQSEELPVISFGKSDNTYSSSVTNYTAKLRNQCALVKFNVSSTKENNLVGQVGVKGLLNKVSVNLTTNVFEYSTVDGSEGIIKLNKVGKSGGEYWAVLLPQETALQPTGETFAYSTEGLYGSFITSIQSIKPNGLYNDDSGCVTVTLNNEREFSIDDAGKKVRFSPGNLYYDYVQNQSYNAGRVHFERNQTDYSAMKPSSNGNRLCHFKWVGDGSAFWKRIVNNGSGSKLFCESGVTVDNCVGWFTMTKAQYDYFYSQNKICYINIGGYGGAMIVPDEYDREVCKSYDEKGWLIEESNGVVLLPGAGYWPNFKDNVMSENVRKCYYWTSTPGTSNGTYYGLYVDNSYLELGAMDRQEARSIRLVKDVVSAE